MARRALLGVFLVVLVTGCGSSRTTTVMRAKGPAVRAHGAFLLMVGGGPPNYTGNIYLVNAAGGAPRVVAKGVSGEPWWSPDGKRVLASAVRHGSDSVFGLDVLSYPVGGGRPLDLTPTRRWVEQGAQWSPDGRRVAYTLDNGTVYDVSGLYVVPATGGRSRFVENASSFAWSPDSRRLALSWPTVPPKPGVWVVPASGGRDRERPLGTGEASYIIEWGRGGRLLFGVDCPGQGGCSVGTPSSTHLWTGKEDEEVGIVDEAQFLPDGTVAFLDGRRIGFLRPDGTRRMVGPLPDRGTSAAWSPDGRYVALASTSTGRVYVARADGGGARRLPISLGRQIKVFGWQPRP